MIKSVHGLKIGQFFWHNGAKYKVESFSTRSTVVGKAMVLVAGLPSTVKFPIKDIKREEPMDLTQRALLKDYLEEILKESGVTLTEVRVWFDRYMVLYRHNPARIVRKAAIICGVEPTEIMSKSREENVVMARAICFYHLVTLGVPLALISYYFSRSHATVINSRDQFTRPETKSKNRHAVRYRKELLRKYDMFLTLMAHT